MASISSTHFHAARPLKLVASSDGIAIPRATGGPVLDLDLMTMAAQLRNEGAWSDGRNTRTVLKHSDFRMVLTAMKKGARLREHQARGTVLIQVLSGLARIQVFDEVFDLPAGHALSLDPNLQHGVEALEDSALLVAVAWPQDSHAETSLRESHMPLSRPAVRPITIRM